jgi:hypothetical protein
MDKSMFELEFETFLESQKKSATGQRLEMLNRDLSCTKKLLEVVVWPVLQSFKRIILEHEIMSSTGVKLYIDIYYEPLGIAFESEGFVVHAEKITRDRFSFDKMRIRSIGQYEYRYTPFSRDELDKQPEACRRSFYEIIGKYSTRIGGRAFKELSVYEREVIRYGLLLNRPFRVSDVKECLNCEYKRAHGVITQLRTKKLIEPCGTGKERVHSYVLLPMARKYLLG